MYQEVNQEIIQKRDCFKLLIDNLDKKYRMQNKAIKKKGKNNTNHQSKRKKGKNNTSEQKKKKK